MYNFSFPTRILLGEDALAGIAAEADSLGVRRPLIVSDPAVVGLGLAERVRAALPEALRAAPLFSGVRSNPLEEECHRGAEAYRDARCDSIIAVGGGSVIDVAKTIKLLASHPPPVSRYEEANGGEGLIGNPMPPLIAIPTTAGTGSEVGRAAVITAGASGRKMVIFHPALMPQLALLAPEFTAAMPRPLAAASGVDALTHAVEAYLSPLFHPMCDGIALEAVKLICRYLPQACEEGENAEAGQMMLLAAAMGATAFQKGLGMVHSLAHALSALCDTHHGLANALMLAPSLRHIEGRATAPEQQERIAQLQRLFAEHGYAAPTLAEAVADFIATVGIEPGLRRQGVSQAQLPALARAAFEDGIHATNMVPVTEEDLLAVLTAAH